MSSYSTISAVILCAIIAPVSADQKICDFQASMYISANDIVIGKSNILVVPNNAPNNPIYNVTQTTIIETQQIIRQVWEPIDDAFPASGNCSNESKNIFKHSYQERGPQRVSFEVLARNETTKRLCANGARTTTTVIDNSVRFTFSSFTVAKDSFLGFDLDTNVEFNHELDGFITDLFPKELINSMENLVELFASFDDIKQLPSGELVSSGFRNLHFNESDGFNVMPSKIVRDKNGITSDTQVRFDNGNLAFPNESIEFKRSGKTNAVKSCLVMERLCDLSGEFVDNTFRKYHETPKKLIRSGQNFKVVSTCYIDKVYFTGR
ncbi:hypothetical protein K5B43_000583 [Vibrio parahaemolyticus]|nr:hypothetical protein [Vibrio parahaemolyticus]